MIAGILFLVVLVGGFFFFKKKKTAPVTPVNPEHTPHPTETIDVPQPVISVEHERTVVPSFSSENACTLSLDQKIFSSSVEANVKIGMVFFLDKEMTKVFDGNGMWFSLVWRDVVDFGGRYSVKIGDDGKVQEWVKCS